MMSRVEFHTLTNATTHHEHFYQVAVIDASSSRGAEESSCGG